MCTHSHTRARACIFMHAHTHTMYIHTPAHPHTSPTQGVRASNRKRRPQKKKKNDAKLAGVGVCGRFMWLCVCAPKRVSSVQILCHIISPVGLSSFYLRFGLLICVFTLVFIYSILSFMFTLFYFFLQYHYPVASSPSSQKRNILHLACAHIV